LESELIPWEIQRKIYCFGDKGQIFSKFCEKKTSNSRSLEIFTCSAEIIQEVVWLFQSCTAWLDQIIDNIVLMFTKEEENYYTRKALDSLLSLHKIRITF